MDTTELALKIRRHALMMTSRGKASHIASILSMADIIAVLYGKVLRLRPEEPDWPDRDRFILGKGHAAAGVYAALAERAFFPADWLDGFYQTGSRLSGHITHVGVPGVDFSTGSLGHGLPVGAGMAYAARLDDRGHRVFVALSEGDCDEGSTWEAALFAAHHRLSNLVAILDYNKLQSLDTVANTLGLEPLADKWRAFGWEVREIDGHDHRELAESLDAAPAGGAKPRFVIAHTVKGRGVSFMENQVLWHYRSPQGDELDAALRELDD